MISERGSALVYILIAIALLAALTASFMQPGNQQVTSQNIVKAVSEIESQVNLIRSAIQECVLMYPSGHDALIGQSNFPFPINPTSNRHYYDHNFEEDYNHVRGLVCPGKYTYATLSARLFGGASGKFLPPPPPLFEEWEYHNGVDGVFFYTYTDKTDAYLRSALEKLDENFSECEADIIVADGADVEMTSTARAEDPECTDGTTCFRVWMIVHTGASYAYQPGGKERLASCAGAPVV